PIGAFAPSTTRKEAPCLDQSSSRPRGQRQAAARTFASVTELEVAPVTKLEVPSPARPFSPRSPRGTGRVSAAPYRDARLLGRLRDVSALASSIISWTNWMLFP